MADLLRGLNRSLVPHRRRAAVVGTAACTAALMLCLPAAAFAAVPTVLTSDVVSTGTTTATVHGSVNPGGQSTTYAVQYDLASSDWCQSVGTSGSPANTTVPQALGFTDNTSHDVSVLLTGLSGDTDYCAQLIANNVDGEGDGGQVTWGAPVAETFFGSSTGATTCPDTFPLCS